MTRNAHALMILAVVSLLGGCTNVSVVTVPFPEVPKFPPTDMYTVAVFRSEPIRPHDRLGEVYLELKGNPSTAELEQKLQVAAAEMGADGVVIVADKTNLMGGTAPASWWGRETGQVQGGDVVAVAIRYLQ